MRVPEGWKNTKLGNITSWASGGTPSKTNADYWNGVIPWISASTMKGHKFSKSNLSITEQGLKSGSKLAQTNDLLLLVRGSMLWNKIPIGIATQGLAFNQDVKCISTQQEKILPEFLLYWFLSNENMLRHMVTGTGIGAGKLDTQELLSLKINCPPLPEQQKISQILSTWDKAIEKLEALIAAKQKRKKSLMQQLLTGEKRFSGFEGEWKEYRLEQLCHFKKGKGLSKGKLNSNGKYKCILYGELYTKYGDVIGNVVSRTNEVDSVKSVCGDILIPSSTTTSGIDLANAVALLEDNVLLGGDINILRPDVKKVCSEFIAYLLTHIKKHQIASRAQGITIIHLYGSDLKPLIVNLPSIKEQQKIASVISAADKEIKTHQNQHSALKQQKKGLMQQLLTGKKRVKLEEAA